MNLFIHEIGHVLVYLFLMFALYLGKRNYLIRKNVIFGFILSILLDLDHFIDYFLQAGFTNFDSKKFISGSYFELAQKIYVLFHGWEYMVIFFLFFLISKNDTLKSLFLILGIAIAGHLAYDLIWYGFDPQSYSIFYRAINSFNISLFNH